MAYEELMGEPMRVEEHPANNYKVAANELDRSSKNIPSTVSYEASHAGEKLSLGKDLGSALRLMGKARSENPSLYKDVKMGASYD